MYKGHSPLALVAASAIFWKASRKAAIATSADLWKQNNKSQKNSTENNVRHSEHKEESSKRMSQRNLKSIKPCLLQEVTNWQTHINFSPDVVEKKIILYDKSRWKHDEWNDEVSSANAS